MNKKTYLTLSNTWGLPMILLGKLVSAILRLCGFKPKTWAACNWYAIGKNWGGISIGRTIITDDEPTEDILDHEFGHSIQNAMFGFLFPFIVAIPSVIRYWKREIDYKKGKELPPYDSIWFEGQATSLGKKYRPIFDEVEKK